MNTKQILSFLSNRLRVRASILAATFLLLFGVANAQKATDFAIFSADDVSLETYSVVRGDVYSGGDLIVKFGYGIQDTDLNSGNMFAFENYTQELSSDVNGSVFVNGDATLEGSADIFFDLTYGGFYSASTSADVNGVTQQQSNNVAAIALPPASQFSVGTDDVISNLGVSLAPGAYRNLEINSSFIEFLSAV